MKKLKINSIETKQEKEYVEFLEQNKEFIKILSYKKYKTSIELYEIISKLSSFFNENPFFKIYCKNNNISSYFLKRSPEGSVMYKLKEF